MYNEGESKICLGEGGKCVRSKRIICMALMWVFVMLCSGQNIWASDLSVTSTIGVDGRYKYGRYIPVNVTIENNGEDFSGIVQVRPGNSTIVYEEAINVAAGTSKKVSIPVQSDGYTYIYTKLLDGKDKEISFTKSYVNSSSYVFGENDVVIGILDDEKNKIKYLSGIDVRINNSFQTKCIDITPEMIDEKVQNLDLFDIIVVNNFNTSSLFPEQLTTIKTWVEQGGTLIIGTGDNASKTLSGLNEDLLSVKINETHKETIDLLGESVELEISNLEGLEDDFTEKKRPYRKLYGVCNRGIGKIIVMKYDLEVEPMASFSKNLEFWKKILSEEVADIRLLDDMSYYNNALYNIGRIKRDNLPRMNVLLIILMIYMVMVGIVSYFILKKKSKKEYIWVVAPIIAVVTTGIFYGISLKSRLKPFVQNQLDVIKVDENGNASRISNVAILNTQGRKFNVVESDDMHFKMFTSNAYRYYYDENAQPDINEYVRYENGRINYTKDNSSVYDSCMFISQPQYTKNPNYTSGLSLKGSNYIVNFKNTSDRKIDRLLVLYGGSIWDLNEVEVGAEITRELNVTGKRPVYELTNEFRQDEKLADVGNAIETVADDYMYGNQREFKPIYLAITKEDKQPPLLVENDGTTDFYYSIVVGKMKLNPIYGEEVLYPYDYFSPMVENQMGSGWIDESSPIMTIYENLEVDLIYYIAPEHEVENITLGLNGQMMTDFYYNRLKGEVQIYNYTSGEYETIDVVTKEYTIEKDKIDEYLKEDAVRIKIKGQNEESGLVPSIKIGGKGNAAN